MPNHFEKAMFLVSYPTKNVLFHIFELSLWLLSRQPVKAIDQ